MSDVTAEGALDVSVEANGKFTNVSVDGAAMTMTNEEFAALREFFRNEVDDSLGRWRWPEDNDYVVYPPASDGLDLVVVNERTSARRTYSGRASAEGRRFSRFDAAALAYYDAHPVMAAWHAAKPGEVWVINYGGTVDFAAEVIGADTDPAGRLFRSQDTIVTVLNTAIVSGRRIWPEATS